MIGCVRVNNIVSIARLQCQTDFVAKIPEFHELLSNVTILNLVIPDGINSHRIDKLHDLKVQDFNSTNLITVKEKMDKLMVKTGEIIFFENLIRLETGLSDFYLHNGTEINGIQIGRKIA